jgi:hypothetical protein
MYAGEVPQGAYQITTTIEGAAPSNSNWIVNSISPNAQGWIGMDKESKVEKKKVLPKREITLKDLLD